LIDETAARVLQERYLCGERGAIGGLYAELRALGEIACRKRGMRSDEIPDTTHLAACRIIERYLKGSYYVMRFGGRQLMCLPRDRGRTGGLSNLQTPRGCLSVTLQRSGLSSSPRSSPPLTTGYGRSSTSSSRAHGGGRYGPWLLMLPSSGSSITFPASAISMG
jgi:hypothetical protein